jgi:hypothetical protein
MDTSARPAPPTPPEPVDNVDALRAAIDSGHTGDKVAVSDPAAAPLGTDAEAAGTPPTPGEVAQSRSHESRPGARAQMSPGLTRNLARGLPGAGVGALVGVGAAVVLGGVLALLLL